MDLPRLKKFTNPIIRGAGIVDFPNAVDNTTEGSGVRGHVIRGTYVRSILTVSTTNTLPLISGYPDLSSCPPTNNPYELNCCYMRNDIFTATMQLVWEPKALAICISEVWGLNLDRYTDYSHYFLRGFPLQKYFEIAAPPLGGQWLPSVIVCNLFGTYLGRVRRGTGQGDGGKTWRTDHWEDPDGSIILKCILK
jgi:hypothetical protein